MLMPPSTTDYKSVWILSAIAVLIVFDGLRVAGIPILNSFMVATFLVFLPIQKWRLSPPFLIFFLLNIGVYAIALVQALLRAKDILFDVRYLITYTGLLLQIFLMASLLRTAEQIKNLIAVFVTAFLALAILNILTTLGLIEPISGGLKNNMEYIEEGFLRGFIAGKGQFLQMTNGNFALLLIIALAGLHFLKECEYKFYKNKFINAACIFITISSGVFVQSRALLIAVSIFYAFLLYLKVRKSRHRYAFEFTFLSIVVVALVSFGPTIYDQLFSNANSVGTRVGLNETAFQIFAEHPVLGVSMSTQNSVAFEAYGLPVHNYYLRNL